jgi:hypothetical protein
MKKGTQIGKTPDTNISTGRQSSLTTMDGNIVWDVKHKEGMNQLTFGWTLWKTGQTNRWPDDLNFPIPLYIIYEATIIWYYSGVLLS